MKDKRGIKGNYNYHYYSYMRGKYKTESEYIDYIENLTDRLGSGTPDTSWINKYK